MTKNAEEIFMRMLAQAPLVWATEVKAGPDRPEIPAHYRERTDAELDVFVQYAVRADEACRRENRRFAEAHPVPRPMPTAVPPPDRNRSAGLARAVDTLTERLFR